MFAKTNLKTATVSNRERKNFLFVRKRRTNGVWEFQEEKIENSVTVAKGLNM